MKRLLSIICICVLCISAQAQSVIGVTRTGQLGTIGDNLPFVNQYGQIVTSPALSPTGQSFDILRPSIITNVDVTEVTKTSATTGGRLVYGGTSEVTECGVCYGTSNYPTLLNSHVTATPNANGEFTVTLTGLQPNTTYYVCAYATNAWGTSYGTTWSFTTRGDATISITGNTDSKTYNGREQSVTGYTVSIPEGVNISEDQISYSGTATAQGTAIGTYYMGLSADDFTCSNANYDVVFTLITDGSLTINRAGLTIKADNATKVYGEANPTSYTATVTGLVDNFTPTYTVTRTEGEAAGTYTITAAGATEQGNYTVTYEPGTFTISKKAATVNADNKSKVYGENDPELTATVEGAETLNYTLSRATGENAGEYTITVNLGSNPNYEVTATNGTFTINKKTATVTADNKSKVYGETDPELTATVEGAETLNYTLTRAAGETAGDYTITVNLGINPNYEVTAANGTFTINKKSATVTVDANQSKVYGSTEPTLTATVAGVVGNDALNYSLSRAEGESVGTYAITVTLGQNPNYDVTATNGTFTITKATATVTADNKSKVYGETDPELTATVEGAETLNYTLTRAAGETAGDYSITVNIGSNPNYDVTAINGTFTVNKKAATVTADNKSKVYGTADPELTATVEGTVGNDMLNYSLARATGDNAGEYAITVTLGENPNYDVTTTNGVFTITAVDEVVVTITGNTITTTYDGAPHTATGYSVVNISNPLYTEDDFILSGGSAEVTRTAVGTSIMGLTPDMFKNINENFTDVSFIVTDGYVTIDKKAATVTAVNNSKVYGATDPTLTATVNGVVGTETLNYTVARAEGENAGEYTITVTMGENPNYEVTATNGTFTINKATATVTITGNSDTKTYNAQEQSVTGYNVTIPDGINITTDQITYSGNATASGTDVGNYTMTLTASDFSCSNPNYDVNFTVTNGSLTITKATATVTANNASKTYGASDPASFTATVSGVLGSDVLNYSLARETGENAGTYAITVTLGENPNYNVTATNGTFTINKATATVTADDKTKVAGEADPELTATVEGTVGNDVLNYELSRATGENVGHYTITVTLGNNPNYEVTATNGTFTITLPECPVLGTTTYTPNPVTGSATTITLTTPVNNVATGVEVNPQYSALMGTTPVTVSNVSYSNGTMTGTIAITNAMRNQSITVTPTVSTTGCQAAGTITGDPVEICVQPVLPSFGTVSNTNGSGKANLFKRQGVYTYATINNGGNVQIQEVGFYISKIKAEVQNHTCSPVVADFSKVDIHNYQGASSAWDDPEYTDNNVYNTKVGMSNCGIYTYYQPYMIVNVCGEPITIYGNEVKQFNMWAPEDQNNSNLFTPTVSASPNPVSSGTEVTLTASSWITMGSLGGHHTIPDAFSSYSWALSMLGASGVSVNNWTYRWEDESGNTIHSSHTSGTTTVHPNQTTTYTAYGEFTYGGETCRVSKPITVTVTP